MKQKLTPIAFSLCLMGLVSSSSLFAATTNTSGATNHNQSLQQQLSELRSEVAALKRERNNSNQSYAGARGNNNGSRLAGNYRVNGSSNGNSFSYNTSHVDPVPPTPKPSAQDVATANRESATDHTQDMISGPQYLPQSGLQYLPIDVDVPGQSFVSTGPYIGVPLQFNGSDLIINNPSVNEDVYLLNLRKNIIQRLRAMGLKETDQHSHLLLSGVIEGAATYRDVGGGKNSSDIDLTNAGLDAYILGPSTLTTGLISIRYDNSIGAQEGSLSMNARTQNSRVIIDKAFIVLGDFTKSPIYGTIGQMYVPFGQYSSTMISSPLTKLLFRTQTRAVLLGFQEQCPNAFYGAAYTFKGDSYVKTATRLNGGINGGYKFDLKKISGNIGGGYIANIADSQGLQNNGLGAVYVPPAPGTAVFGGFGAVAGTGSERLVHRVAAWNARGLVSFGKTVDLIAEYITAANKFSPADLTLKDHGARPQALNVELAYTFQGLPRPTAISAGYGMTKDALAIGMPLNRWSGVINTSIWRNTLQSLEFRHDKNYGRSIASSGSGVPGPTASGRSDNIVTAQFDLYF